MLREPLGSEFGASRSSARAGSRGRRRCLRRAWATDPRSFLLRTKRSRSGPAFMPGSTGSQRDAGRKRGLERDFVRAGAAFVKRGHGIAPVAGGLRALGGGHFHAHQFFGFGESVGRHLGPTGGAVPNAEGAPGGGFPACWPGDDVATAALRPAELRAAPSQIFDFACLIPPPLEQPNRCIRQKFPARLRHASSTATCVLARVPHSSNITRVRIAKARAAAQRSRRADFCNHGFLVAVRKSFLFCFHAIASFLNLVRCG